MLNSKQILKRIGTILLILFIPFLVLFIFSSKEEAHLIIKSYSPNQQYELKGYQVDTQTTIPNYVVADLYNKKTGKKIQNSFYTQYGKSNLDIKQSSNNYIFINENKVSLKKIQKNDFTKEEK